MKKGFTLAEVLITLSIVGIIAALTVPSIVSNYRNRVYISGVKKALAELEHATKAIMSDEQSDNFYRTTAGVKSSANDKGAKYFLKEYFKFQDDNTQNSIAAGYSAKNGAQAGTIPSDDDAYCSKNTNGVVYCMEYDASQRESTVFFDINGKADPNIAGIDAFVVKINRDGSLEDTDTVEDENGNARCNSNCTPGGDVRDCAAGCLKKLMDDNWEYKD